jgi:hypothetical protein
MTKPSVFMKQWWNKDLSKMKKAINKLSEQSWRYRGIIHDSHRDLEMARQEYGQAIISAKELHWREFLEDTTERELWIAHKYISNPTGDGGCTRIPPLKVKDENGAETEAVSNEEKSKVFTKTLFPPPLEETTVPDEYDYPEPLNHSGRVTESQIQRQIARLSPFKACGPDGVPNIVLKRASESLVLYLIHIFRVVFALNVYHTSWRESITVILRKPGKPDYTLPKAYCPIALLNTTAKLLTAIMAEDLSYLMEKHQLIPSTQFRGRAGRMTTDSIHLAVNWIKHQWRQGNVVSALFLDIEGAFPNAVLD